MNLTAWALLGVALGAGQPTQRGQAPQGGDFQVTKSRSLQIGIDYKPERKRDIRSVLLYMSRDLGSTWELVAQELPTKQAFTFNAPSDGVYFINMAIQYQDGKTDPPDVSRVPPAQKIIVDTTKPLVLLSSAQRSGEEVSVEWTIEEKNPNEASTRVFYRPVLGDNASWQTVPPEKMARNSARFTPTISGAILVQVVNADLAGNIGSGTREVTSGSTSMTATSTNNSYGPPPVQPKPANSEIIPAMPAMPAAGAEVPLAPTTVGPAAPPIIIPPRETPLPVATVPSITPPAVAAPSTPNTQNFQPVVSTPIDHSIGAMPIVIDPPQKPIAMTGGGVTSQVAFTGAMPAPEVSPIQYSKSPRFDLNYQVESGPSGVMRIDLYATRDDGKNWTKWSTHEGRESPLKVALDTRLNTNIDGEYGFRLVAVSGAGLSDGAPQPGSAPDARVHLDTIPPVIKVFQPTADSTNKNTLILHWEATDKNFGKESVAIEYSESASGPWKPVLNPDGLLPVSVGALRKIPNTGTYGWQLPNNLATPKVYLRFTAWDLAGNRSEVTTPHPILVDLMKPKARLQGISISGR